MQDVEISGPPGKYVQSFHEIYIPLLVAGCLSLFLSLLTPEFEPWYTMRRAEWKPKQLSTLRCCIGW